MEVNSINKASFITELSKLLSFMPEEDRLAAVSAYESMFDKAADCEALSKALVSPTRQAVNVARAYNNSPVTPDGEVPAYLQAVDKIRNSPAVAEVLAAPAPQEAPASEPDPIGSIVSEFAETSAESGVSGSLPQEADESVLENEAAVDELLQDFEEESQRTFRLVRKPVPALIVLFLLISIPLGLAGILLMIVLAAAFLALAAGVGALGIWLILAALKSGFDILADMIVVAGTAIVFLAVGLLFLWTAVWFLGGAIPGIIRGLRELGGKWCYKEVEK